MRAKNFFRGFLGFAGIQTLIVFSLLILITGEADRLYPDTVYCFAGDDPARGVFSVESRDGDVGGESEVSFLGMIPVKTVDVRYFEKKQLIPGGMTFGVKLFTQGLLVTQTGAFVSGGKSVDPAKAAGIRRGDVIRTVDGAEVTKVRQLSRLVEESRGRTVTLGILRDGDIETVSVTPRFCDEEKRYRAGLWVKDSAAGIGTVTYIDPGDLSFAGLGHGICDQSTGAPVPISSGEVWEVKVEGVVKGEKGDPGELQGVFGSRQAGIITDNTLCGVFGELYRIPAGAAAPVDAALSGDVREGEASVLCSVDPDGVKSYSARIERIVDRSAETKNFVIRITDPRLLELTGGIVQGMSGSPVMQDGKLVGAVTHVMVNDPTRGYGIFIENMLEASGKVQRPAA